jgi:hypothetical protein
MNVIFLEPFDGEFLTGRIIGEPFDGWFAIKFDNWVGIVPETRFVRVN